MLGVRWAKIERQTGIVREEPTILVPAARYL